MFKMSAHPPARSLTHTHTHTHTHIHPHNQSHTHTDTLAYIHPSWYNILVVTPLTCSRSAFHAVIVFLMTLLLAETLQMNTQDERPVIKSSSCRTASGSQHSALRAWTLDLRGVGPALSPEKVQHVMYSGAGLCANSGP